MTTTKEAAMQQALNALDRVQPQIRGAIPQQDVEDAIDALRAALAEPDEFIEDETIYCPTCGEEDGGTTCGMPDCGLRCGAEPVQEPVAWRITDGEGDWDYRTELPEDWSIQWSARYGRKHEPLFTTPPQRKPLSREEIVRIYETAEIAGSYFETGTEMAIAITRAVEKAHGIGVKE